MMTQLGRVVYDRKLNRFRSRDLVRVFFNIRSLAFPKKRPKKPSELQTHRQLAQKLFRFVELILDVWEDDYDMRRAIMIGVFNRINALWNTVYREKELFYFFGDGE